MQTSSHSPAAPLLFNTNHNGFLVPRPPPETRSSGRRCTTHIRAHTPAWTALRQTRTNISGNAAKLMRLSEPQFRGNEPIPQRALPARNDSISPLADCTYNTFSSHFVKQSHSILRSNTRSDADLNASGTSDWLKSLKRRVKKRKIVLAGKGATSLP